MASSSGVQTLVDLSKMEDRHIIITYTFDRATIHELSAQLEPDLMSAIHAPAGIPPLVQNLALRRQVPFLQEDGPDDGLVAAVETVDSEEEEAQEEDIDNRNNIIMQYFQ
ncbi:hypothetical protein NDU88_005625 [Pleurodeles waltl]|uniref:Uncharacterized protein n=1 Tax=Pleurodeles waltl TaxID=8319 RepID=A0AAV7RK72_PLEWA|nr:hypothetical protein NDU88_005625 [Pleurodeles waltl]